MKSIAIIPARSGSKGLKDKNIKQLCGKPLLAYSIECAIESCKFDKVFVSTDSQEYARIAEEYGADASFLLIILKFLTTLPWYLPHIRYRRLQTHLLPQIPM